MAFRTRIFVVAAVVISLVLAGILALAQSRVLAFELERIDARLCQESRRLATEPMPGSLPALLVDLTNKLHLDSANQLLLRVEQPGRINLRSGDWPDETIIHNLRWQAVRQRDEPPRADSGDTCSVASLDIRAGEWRVARFQAPQGQALVALDLAAPRGELRTALRSALWPVAVLAFALCALCAGFLADFAMRPLNRLREAMKRVDGQGLDQRLPRHGEDREFRELIDAYNTMLERLAASFRQASRFSADAAHELRTPLTILQGRIEHALTSDDGQHDLDLTATLDEIGRLTAIVRKLLLLSQADAGQLPLQRESVDLHALLDDLLADAAMLLDGQTMTQRLAAELQVQGDALLLRQLFNNLVANALRYSRRDAAIEVVAERNGDVISVRFSNDCDSLSPEERRHFFDRFHRGQSAREQAVEGSGLGLSLAREIARAHGGDLILEASPADKVILTVRLPRR